LLISGVESFDIDIKEQKVTVKGNIKPEDVFQTVSKTGKKTAFWEGEVASPAAPAPAAEAAPAAATEPEITPAKADA
jgi:copper chaperone